MSTEGAKPPSIGPYRFRATDPAEFGRRLGPVAANVTTEHGGQGRFSANHRRAFGELPSATLRRHRCRLHDQKRL